MEGCCLHNSSTDLELLGGQEEGRRHERGLLLQGLQAAAAATTTAAAAAAGPSALSLGLPAALVQRVPVARLVVMVTQV